MTETNDSKTEPAAAWCASDRQTPVAATSMLPGSERPAPAAVGLLKHAVRGAHDTIDRLAGRAEPVVRQLGESVAAAEGALHAKAGQLRQTGDVWVDGLRCSVRSHPLTAVAVAAALGALLARSRR